jgi:hypothetical protein
MYAIAHALDGLDRAEAWFADEARVGDKGRRCHRW